MWIMDDLNCKSLNVCVHFSLFLQAREHGKIVWHFRYVNTETKSRKCGALSRCIWMHHFASGSSLEVPCGYGLHTKPWFNFSVKVFQISEIWRWNSEHFPCSNIFYIQALYEYESMCADSSFSMLVCGLSAISLNVYIYMKMSRYTSRG